MKTLFFLITFALSGLVGFAQDKETLAKMDTTALKGKAFLNKAFVIRSPNLSTLSPCKDLRQYIASPTSRIPRWPWKNHKKTHLLTPIYRSGVFILLPNPEEVLFLLKNNRL